MNLSNATLAELEENRLNLSVSLYENVEYLGDPIQLFTEWRKDINIFPKGISSKAFCKLTPSQAFDKVNEQFNKPVPSNLTITDLFDNTIKVTDIDGAINQAKGGVGIDVNTAPFENVNGISQDIKGRENELVSMSDYWQDSLNKLNLLKAKKLWSELGNTPVNDDNEIEEPFLHFDAGEDCHEIWQ